MKRIAIMALAAVVFVTGSVVYALKAISRDEQYDTQLSRLQEGGA